MPIRITSAVSPIRKYIVGHKVLSGFLAIVVLGGGYYTYKYLNPTGVETRYVLNNVATGTIVAAVSGSGQVSASNKVDIKPRVAGTITSVLVKEGQTVGNGAVIAYIDAADAQKAVRDAQTSLETAQLSLDKVMQPTDSLTLTQAQNNVAKAQDTLTDAQDSLPEAYDDTFSQIDSAYLNLPDVMTGLNTIIFGTDRTLGGSGQWNIDFYTDSINAQNNSLDANTDRQKVMDGYNAAKSAFDKATLGYKATSGSSSQGTVDAVLAETINATALIATTAKDMSNLIQRYQDTMTAHNRTPAATSDTQINTLGGYITTANSQQSSLKSNQTAIKNAQQSITSAQRSLSESQASLAKTTEGPDSLDVRSAQIAVQQRKDALTDAQNALADYSIRAPFAGTIASLDISRGDSVSSGTTAATIITNQEIAELSLNEIDATKVKVGQKATLTFDAIEDLTVTGTVAAIDSLGTVTQGVVSYTIKIGFDTQDARVKPGMTVNADIQTAVRQNVLVVPASAVKTTNGAHFVLIFEPALAETGGTTGVVSEKAPVSREVTIGISDGTNTEISSGLTAGQQIVTRTVSGSAATAPAAAGNARGAVGGIRL